MDETKQKIYYHYLEALIKSLTRFEGPDLPGINHALGEICQLVHISKGVTLFYNSLEHEKKNRGEEFVCYDSGEACEILIEKRFVTEAMTVVICRVYQAVNTPPLEPWERERVELLMQTIMGFLSSHRLKQIVEKLRFYDEDGYRNRRHFMRMLEYYAENQKIFGKDAVCYNLRHFTMVNQEFGRAAGDITLRNHYEELMKRIGGSGTVCRLAGDTFVAIFEEDLLEEVLDYLAETPVIYDANTGQRVMISCWVGVLRISDDLVIHSLREILDRIMATSQEARRGGKEQIVFYTKAMKSDKERVMRIQNRFPAAIENEEFHVFYQPKVDVEHQTLAGAEALCRWFRDGKIIPPNDFIPVLEQNTEICKLDFYMLDRVCKDIRRWLDEGRQVERISVNLSRKNLMDIDLLSHILEIVDTNHVPHQYIEIELTETTTDVEFRDLKRVVSGLQKAGIHTSVDDFGMGYSSLNLIRDIPWDVLKVDKSFLPLEGDGEFSTRSIMFKYVVAMAREMGLQCIAEGVETLEQVRVLQENHCELAQGYFFDKPLPVEEFEKRLEKHTYSIN